VILKGARALKRVKQAICIQEENATYGMDCDTIVEYMGFDGFAFSGRATQEFASPRD